MLNNNSSSRFLTLLIALLLYLTTGFSQLLQSTQGSERFPPFDNFVEKFNKHYQSQTEYLKRQHIYLSNIEYIKNSNCTSCGVNFFADWTQTEISGLRTVKESPVQQKIGAFSHIQTPLSERRLTETVPQTFDWRNNNQVTSVKSEGYCGASWAFSTTAFFEQESIMAGLANKTLDLSESYLIACNVENQGCKAGEIESSIDKVINNRGLPLEKQYAFNPDIGSVSTICLETNFFVVPNVSRISYYKIYDPEAIKKIIFKKPVIAAVCGLDMSFHFPSSNLTPGRTLHCKPHNRIIDHSVLLIGYTETQWIVKNHWGTGWGINGYAYISRNPSEDCCIGEQLHSSGAITAQCSVQYCQTCVETDTCYKCEPGRWVKHNTTTGVQTCEPCTETNCTECYNYRGTCKWCADGFGINATVNTTLGRCVAVSIANCNMISGTNCMQCKSGYLLNPVKTACSAFCSVKNCNKCINGPCTDCRSGFSLENPVVNGKNTQYCLLNPCTVGNCLFCNSTGQCVTCIGGFTLQANGVCTTNCTISNCVNCALGSTSCTECADPRSWNSSKRVCQVFAGTSNCRVHRTLCTSCRSGFTLSLTSQCVQNCEFGCSVCMRTDTSICLNCSSGYYLANTTVNGTRYAAACLPNPCNITNCTLCGANGVGCVLCATKYLIYNSTSNVCQNQCKLENCRDCMTTGATAGECDLCNPGYCIDYSTYLCVNCSISNCLQVYDYENVQYCWSCMKDYYTDKDELNCFVYCTDYYCESCEVATLYACTKCYEGFFMYLVDGALVCKHITPTVKGCEYISFNQTYCYYCSDYYVRNKQTGLCQLNTNNCPIQCEYCTTNGSYNLGCKCVSGVFEWYSQECIVSPFNDTDCYIVELYGSKYYCMECLDGKIVNLNQTGCEPQCIISNCTRCEQGYNYYCWVCNQGFFLTKSWTCQKCPFENCRTCKTTANCIQCLSGYQLAPNQRQCLPIICPQGFLFTGYECICPTGTYYTPLSCEACQQLKCKSCSATKCYNCQVSYYLTSDFQCFKCLPNCKQCSSGQSCDYCADGFLYDTNTSQCISPSAQGGAFFISGATVIKCPFSCLQCDSLGKCTQCLPGFSTVGGSCLNCQGSCKTCQSTNVTACISCEDGYFLNQTKCVKCSDLNCEKCAIASAFCEKCREGFYMDNNTCKACAGTNCLSCNIYGECTKCSSGYGLTANNTCQQCAGNCIACTGSTLNQCLVICNLTQYEVDGTCKNCPLKCLSCLSASICSSCVSGYLLRSGSCKPVCAEGCYLCEQTNPDVCLQCFTGYMISQVGTCVADITCNDNQSCLFCPSNWTVINRTCEICNVEGDCVQCAAGNVDQCGLCKDGFFLNSTVCTRCESYYCLKCSSLERCQLCREGFFIPQGEIYGSCKPCEQTCKTCANLPKKCTSCKEGYELSITENCLRLEKIEGEVELDIGINAFPTVSDYVRDDLVQMMGVDAVNGTKYYVITELEEGSVILGFLLAIPEGEDADTTYTEFQSQLSNMTEIGGVPLIAVRKLGLFKPAKNNTNNGTTPEPEVPMTTEPASINHLAIILGVVIPSVIIILAVIAFTFRRKLFKSRDTGVDNFLEEPGKNNSSEVVIHMRGKLPPIISVHNTSFTPLKDQKMDTTGQNRTYFNSTGLPQEQSYSKLEGFNDESRNDFDQTLNNIVAELNQENRNKMNEIDERDNLNDFNEDLGEIKGSQRCMMENEAVHENIDNELMNEIEFNQDSLRKMNELQEHSPEGYKAQVKRGEKGHLQIIQFEKDQVQDL